MAHEYSNPCCYACAFGKGFCEKDFIDSKDGGLFNLGAYVGWTPGDSRITLDGEFTADELEFFISHMRSKS